MIEALEVKLKAAPHTLSDVANVSVATNARVSLVKKISDDTFPPLGQSRPLWSTQVFRVYFDLRITRI